MAKHEVCAGWEIVCPDGRVRSLPYHNLGDAKAHAKRVSQPEHFAKRRCRLAPKPSALELSLPACSGGKHVVRAMLIEHSHGEHGEA